MGSRLGMTTKLNGWDTPVMAIILAQRRHYWQTWMKNDKETIMP